MFGDFDPLLELQMLQHNVHQHQRTINQLVKVCNEQGQLLEEISKQFVTITNQNVELFRMMGEILNNEVK